MSLAYETSEETVSPFRYMVPSVGLKPTTISLKDYYANHCVTMAWNFRPDSNWDFALIWH